MTLREPLASKLGLLIPRLATEFDGEIVATVKAIERTLASAGADWHDLVRFLTLQEPPVGPSERPQKATRPPQPQFKGWAKRPSGDRLIALDVLFELRHLSDWELRFLQSIRHLLERNPHARVSEKQ